MILLINGFELTQWLSHEFSVRNKSCYDEANKKSMEDYQTIVKSGGGGHEASGALLGLLAGKYASCLKDSFSTVKPANPGPIYNPDRSITFGAPYYMGKRMEYWDKVVDIIKYGLNDQRIFFINGSFDNPSNGEIRYQTGVQIGNQVLQQWYNGEKDYIRRMEQAKADAAKPKPKREIPKSYSSMLYQSSILDSLNLHVDPLASFNSEFFLKPNETVKIIGHSMGAAVAAGIASVIRNSFAYEKRLEVVIYLAPHQPGQFIHPAGVKAYQSSAQKDAIASVNKLMGINIAGLKGTTTYEIIRNVPRENYFENETYTWLGSSQRGHSVFTYDDDLKKIITKHMATNYNIQPSFVPPKQYYISASPPSRRR
jgi:hypothetical protein